MVPRRLSRWIWKCGSNLDLEWLNILGLGLKWWMIWEMKDLNNQNSAAKRYKVENHTRQIQPVIINLHAFSPKRLMPEPHGDSHMFGLARLNILI